MSYEAESLRYAAAHGDIADLTKSLKRGLFGKRVDVDSPDSEGRTALMLAAREGYAAAVELLLSAGADVNAAARSIYDHSVKGLTALMFACMNKGSYGCKDKLTIVMTLLAAGADVDARNDRGRTALIVLALGGENTDGISELGPGEDALNIEIAKALLDAGADPNTKDVDGRTAAFWARTDLGTFLSDVERRSDAVRQSRPADDGQAFESARAGRPAGRITEICLFVEPLDPSLNELPVTVLAPATFMPQADRALGLRGALVAFASTTAINTGKIVAPMNEVSKRRYIDERFGSQRWVCYHASSEVYKYNVVVAFA